MANLAVNGAESGDVLKVLDSENVRRLAASADAILLSAGGNDLSHAVPREAAAMTASPLEEIVASRTRYAGNLRQILSRLREANPRAPIYLLGLYDPFGDDGPQARVGASVILSWNTLIEETALSFPKVSVVPTFDLFYGRPDRLAVDHFHPNSKGHQAIAQRHPPAASRRAHKKPPRFRGAVGRISDCLVTSGDQARRPFPWSRSLRSLRPLRSLRDHPDSRRPGPEPAPARRNSRRPWPWNSRRP